MSAPLLIFLFSMLLVLAAFILYPQPGLQAAITSIGAALIAMFVWFGTLDSPIMLLGLPVKVSSSWQILGRAFVIDEGNRATIGFLYLVGAFIFWGAWLARPGRMFFMAGIAALGFVAASLFIRPFLYAAIFLEFGAMAAVLVLASRGHTQRRGGMRLLMLYTLAMMAILLAGWLLERATVTTASPDIALRATVLLALGFAVLMAVPPFHLWLPTAAGESNPYALTFVTVILQSAGLFFMLRFLNTYAWLREETVLFQGIRGAGIVMVWFGGLLALAQDNFSKTMAYALLTDFGVMLLAVGTGETDGYHLALGLNGVRVISLALWAIGLTILLDRQPQGSSRNLQGVAYRFPLASAAAFTGVLSIAGFPLTAGFPGRWALLNMLAPLDGFAGATTIVASLCIGGAAIRWAKTMLEGERSEDRPMISLQERMVLGGGILMCILLGIFPQLIYPWVLDAVTGITTFVP